jgi:dipeptidyl aminopeptidase/acylaminoacyl peptidase
MEHLHPAYRQILGYEPGTAADKMDAKLKTDVSPVTFATKDDPAILLVHGDADAIVPLKHAQVLHKRAGKVGIKSELLVVKGAGHDPRGKEATERVIPFIKENLGETPPK